MTMKFPTPFHSAFSKTYSIPKPRTPSTFRARPFSTTSNQRAPNRLYDPIRSPTDLDTLLLLSASSHTPLLTLWTTSSCPSCRLVQPLISSLVSSGAGESHGGVGFAEVEFDSPTLGVVAGRYMITSIPTLLAFSRGEAQLETRLMDVREMRDEAFLRLWIEDEAARGGTGGRGGGAGILGGLFGMAKA